MLLAGLKNNESVLLFFIKSDLNKFPFVFSLFFLNISRVSFSIKQATIDELQHVPGISEVLATTIYQFLHKED